MKHQKESSKPIIRGEVISKGNLMKSLFKKRAPNPSKATSNLSRHSSQSKAEKGSVASRTPTGSVRKPGGESKTPKKLARASSVNSEGTEAVDGSEHDKEIQEDPPSNQSLQSRNRKLSTSAVSNVSDSPAKSVDNMYLSVPKPDAAKEKRSLVDRNIPKTQSSVKNKGQNVSFLVDI